MDRALEAARVQVDGSERRRLARTLARLSPQADSRQQAAKAGTAVAFTQVLQGLANG